MLPGLASGHLRGALISLRDSTGTGGVACLQRSWEWGPVEDEPLLAELSFLLEIPGNLQSGACGLGAFGSKA